MTRHAPLTAQPPSPALLPSTLWPLPLLLAVAACGGAPAEPAAADDAPVTTAPEAEGRAEQDHGARTDLGELVAFGRTFRVEQYGAVTAGDEAAFEVAFASGRERITTARGWIGVASGRGSMKSLWELEGEDRLHGHVEVPTTLAEGAKLWVEFEVDGATETVSIAYR
ncbi:MAG: hypothetical protein ACON4Z_14950 [Planctomycetota bacterium]